MAQRQATSYISSLFWPAMTLLAAGIAGGAFAYIFAEFAGNGWRQGAALGGLVFVVALFLFGRMMTSELPPPNTVRIDVPPAPTVPRSPSATPRYSAPPTPPASVAEVKETARAAVDSIRETAQAGMAKLSGAAGAAKESVKDQGSSEAPTTSARVTDAARKAAEAAREMAEPAVERVSEAVKPRALEAPRDGGPDDLKKIKGVGPKLEALLHGLGYYHFDQIASWGPGEIAWVDSNLEGFNGRATRDDWVGQARILASGGETEFSNRVEQGEVYDDE